MRPTFRPEVDTSVNPVNAVAPLVTVLLISIESVPVLGTMFIPVPAENVSVSVVESASIGDP